MYVEPRLGKIVLALACGLGVLSAWGCCGSQQRCHSSCGCGGVYAEGAVLEPIPANGHGGCRGCRGKNGGCTTNRDDATEPQWATKPRVLPPHSRFHPVPTRPVFSRQGPRISLGGEVPPPNVLRQQPTPAHPHDLRLEPEMPLDVDNRIDSDESARPDVSHTDDKPDAFSEEEDVRFTDRAVDSWQAQLASKMIPHNAAAAAPSAVRPETEQQRVAIQQASVEWRPRRTRR